MSYSPGEVSELLSVPASTLRRWAVRFEKQLTPQTPEAGRHRSYSNSDIETFRKIRDLAAKGQSLRSIENSLTVFQAGQKPPDTEPDNEPAPDNEPSTEQAQNTALIVVSNNIADKLGAHNAQIEALREQINKQNERLSALTEYLSLPWYKRIGKRPPVKY